MSLPSTEPESPAKPRRSAFIALGWCFACAICAGGVWLGTAQLLYTRVDIAFLSQAQKLPASTRDIATSAAFSGLIAGVLAGFLYSDNGISSVVLGGIGTFAGAIGGGFVVPVVAACRDWLNPLTASTLFWCFIGFFTGLVAYRLSRTRRLSKCKPHCPPLLHAILLLALFLLFLSCLESSAVPYSTRPLR